MYVRIAAAVPPPSATVTKNIPNNELSTSSLCVSHPPSLPTPPTLPQVLPVSPTACSLRHCPPLTVWRSARSTRPGPALFYASPPGSGHGFAGKNLFFSCFLGRGKSGAHSSEDEQYSKREGFRGFIPPEGVRGTCLVYFGVWRLSTSVSSAAGTMNESAQPLIGKLLFPYCV